MSRRYTEEGMGAILKTWVEPSGKDNGRKYREYVGRR